VLINAGTAYARLGQLDKARQAFRAAVQSNNRYELELADGRKMDSREAARLAIGRLEFAGR
jgi:tetratricopeptide (TPR) repeat protein